MTRKFTSLVAAGLAAGAAFSAPAFAQRAMTIEDLFELRQVGGASVAPGGEHVAYTVVSPRNIAAGEADGVSRVHLHIAGADGEGRAYITGDMRVSGVAWRPGAGTVTFRDRRGDDTATGLYEIAVDGGEAQRLFVHSESIGAYAFGPEGETLWFVARPAADPMDATLADRGFRANVVEEVYTNAGLWRVDLSEGGEAERIEIDGHVSDVVVSGDGERVAALVAPNPLVDESLMETDWVVIDADDGDIVTRVEMPGKVGQAAFSPDGRSLAFLAAADRADPTAGTLQVANARNGEVRAIAREAEQHVMDFAWTADGDLLALAHVGTKSALVTYTAEGEERARTPHDAQVFRSIDLDRESGAIAAVADAAAHPRELFTAQGGGAFERRTSLNPQLADIAFGEQRTIRYAARDGVEVEGVLITPQGRTPRGGWPLIMTVHGGPEAHDSDGWLTGYSRPGHIAAGEGFAVFYPNYRGSTGRGEAFAKLDHADAPGDEFWDLVDAIGYLSEEGLVDADRVGITGGSYGGFASAWGATVASEHFAASAPFVALTDLISFWGTTEIPVEMIDVHFMEYPYEAWDTYLTKSPSYNAQGSTTPTLILHGEADTRVDPSQSYILYRFLKHAGEAPVRLVTYPGEGHGNARAAAQYDYAHRVMRWMRHYLQGEGGEPPAAELPLADLLGLEGSEE